MRRRFTQEEDDLIKKLYLEEGIRDWEEIASNLEYRNAKQCKDRFVNFLDENLKNVKWTPEEDDLLREKVKVMGNRWSEIVKFFPHRSPNHLKNRFHHYLIKEPWAEMCYVKKKKSLMPCVKGQPIEKPKYKRKRSQRKSEKKKELEDSHEIESPLDAVRPAIENMNREEVDRLFSCQDIEQI